jgi:hypothetical protein
VPVHTALGTDAQLVCPHCGEVASSFLSDEDGHWRTALLAPCGHRIITDQMQRHIVGDDVLVPLVLRGARLDACLAYCNHRARTCRDAARRLRAGQPACGCGQPDCAVPDWPPERFESWALWWADAAAAHMIGEAYDPLADGTTAQGPGAQVTPLTVATAAAQPGSAGAGRAVPAQAVLFIDASWSYCGACGQMADPHQERHLRCGARFVRLSSHVGGESIRRAAQRLRPDLPWQPRPPDLERGR